MNRNAKIAIVGMTVGENGRDPVVYGAKIAQDGDRVEVGQKLVEWDPYVDHPHGDRRKGCLRRHSRTSP